VGAILAKRDAPQGRTIGASHAAAILVQLARVLGPSRIEELSATDLWLLLEAAYQHDIGMVVSDAQAREWFQSKDFRGHLLRLRHGEERELARAAELLEIAKLDTSATTWPLDVRRAVDLVLADFGRQKHPQQDRTQLSRSTCRKAKSERGAG
jgi:hypothetical protein